MKMYHHGYLTFVICSLLTLVLVSTTPIEGRDIRRNADNEFQINPENLAAAVAFLQELERRHSFNARPRSQLYFTRALPPEVAYKLIGYFILETIDKAHSHQHRPRFGKRGGDATLDDTEAFKEIFDKNSESNVQS